MPEQCDQCLSARVNALVLTPKRCDSAFTQAFTWRQLSQNFIRKCQGQTGITPDHRVSNLIPFTRVEKEYVIGICDRLVGTHVPQVDSPVGKYKVRNRSTFFRRPMGAGSLASEVSKRYRVGLHQLIDTEF